MKNIRTLLAALLMASCGSLVHAEAGPRDELSTSGPAERSSGEEFGRFVEWAREEAIRLDKAADGKASDLSAVEPVIGSATVVAIGEPAHGAHEPLAFRNRLFRFLVEQLGFTAIALETGLSESRRVQDFVAGGPGDLAQIVAENLTWGFGTYPENVELIRWMRAYNADPSHARKLRFYGIDVSGGHMGGMTRARVTLDDALAYLMRADPGISRSVRDGIEPYLEEFTGTRFSALPAHERDELGAAIDRLIAVLERDKADLIDATSEEDYAYARRNAQVAKQLEQMFRAWPPASDADEGLSPEFYRPANVRDAAMADNVRWALEREGADGRILVFAHNAHVMNAPLRGGLWSVYEEAPATMGQHLRPALGDELLIIGTSSAVNGSGLPAAPIPPPSLDLALERIGGPAFLLDLRGARGCPGAGEWLARTQSMRANFTTEIEIEPGIAFDALVFFHRLTPALEPPGGS